MLRVHRACVKIDSFERSTTGGGDKCGRVYVYTYTLKCSAYERTSRPEWRVCLKYDRRTRVRTTRFNEARLAINQMK